MIEGDVLAGRYRLIARVGAGGMGHVWRAEQAPLGRAVAIKVISNDRDQPDLRERFAREAEIAAKIDHRNVVDIIEYGVTDEGDPYLVMPLLRGESLAARLRRPSPAALGEVLTWLRAILSGLAAIHDEGIVHRDLKPANILLAEDADGVVPKLLDFGISRSASGTKRSSLTQLGTAMGTPEYMAPEQFESARDVDHRADLYGVGAILFEAFAGRPPFEAADAFAIYRAMLQGPPPDLAALRPDLPPALVAVVTRALAKDPAARFVDARAMRDAIDALLEGAHAPAALAWSAPSPEDLGMAPTTPAERVVAPTVALEEGVLPGTMASAPKAETPASIGPRAGRTRAVDLGRPTAMSAPPAPPAPEHHASEHEGGSRLAMFAVVLVALIAIGGGVWLFLSAGSSEPRVEPRAHAPLVDDESPDQAAAVAPRALRVALPDRLTHLALAWARLPDADRRLDLRFVPSAARHTIVAGPSVRAADAARVASALGAGAPEPAEWDDARGLRPASLLSTVRLNVHAEPSIESTTLRVLPHDTLVVALYGTMNAHVSSAEGEDALSYFVISPNEAGWALSRFLAPHAQCRPTTDGITTEVGMEGDAIAADALIARTLVHVLGVRAEVYLVSARDRRATRSFAALYRAENGCVLGERIALQRIEGVIDEIFFTETAPAGGQSLLFLSWHPGASPPRDGVMDWAAYSPTESAPVWTGVHPSAAFLDRRARTDLSGSRDRVVRSQREHYVLSIRRPGEPRAFYRWDEIEIVPADTP